MIEDLYLDLDGESTAVFIYKNPLIVHIWMHFMVVSYAQLKAFLKIK